MPKALSKADIDAAMKAVGFERMSYYDERINGRRHCVGVERDWNEIAQRMTKSLNKTIRGKTHAK